MIVAAGGVTGGGDFSAFDASAELPGDGAGGEFFEGEEGGGVGARRREKRFVADGGEIAAGSL